MESILLHRAGTAVPLAGSPDIEVPGRIGWRRGVVVIGTVNVDETTFSFAPKVLDRAAVLEFVDINLELFFKENGRQEAWDKLGHWFEAVQQVTRPYNLHLGYRAALEIVKVIGSELGEAPATWTEARLKPLLDRQLRNKVLPRVRGPRGTAEPVLVGLLALAIGGPETWEQREAELRQLADRGWLEDDVKELRASEAWGPAAEKAWQMLRRLRDVGFTGYF